MRRRLLIFDLPVLNLLLMLGPSRVPLSTLELSTECALEGGSGVGLFHGRVCADRDMPSRPESSRHVMDDELLP